MTTGDEPGGRPAEHAVPQAEQWKGDPARMSRLAARRHTPDVVLPEVNTLIRLTIGPGDEPVAANVPSRVEDVTPADPRTKGSLTELFVAVPHYAGDLAVPRRGTTCTVSWVTPQGVYDLPCGFLDRVEVGPVVRAWRLAVTGPAERAQRRRFVRVPWTASVEVEVVPVVRLPDEPAAPDDAGGPGDVPDPTGADDPVGAPDPAAREYPVDPAYPADPTGAADPGDPERSGDPEQFGTGEDQEDPEDPEDQDGPVRPAGTAEYLEGPCTVPATTLDLSEGGIRCVLPPPRPRDGQPVRVGLEVEGERLVLDATVVRVRFSARTPSTPARFEVGIAFTDPDEYGDVLRRAVFSEQLRIRRSGVE